MREGIRVLMVAGGTGGHIFPALAVAEELQRRGGPGIAPYAIEFLGTHRPLEAKLIPAAGFRLRVVDAAGLNGIGGMQRVRNLLLLPRTAIAVARILREFRPRVVVGVGGYLAGPVMLEAALAGIPTLLIEPNARPGFTNRLLAPVVRAAAVGFAETAHLYGKKAQVTGHPVRRAFFDIPPRRPAPPAATAESLAPFTLLVVGGSQGSKAINQVVVECLPLLEAFVAPALTPAPPGIDLAVEAPPGIDPACADLKVGSTRAGAMRIIHQTGEHDYNEVLNNYQGRSLSAEVHAFIEDMPGALSQADLVISRAGAMAVAELAAAGRAALLIPFPGAADQHQLENALTMEKAGAVRVIVQAELTPQRLAGEIRELMANPATLENMEASARRLARPDAAACIADMVEAFARQG